MRLKSGLLIGIFGIIVVSLGGLYFTIALCILIYLGSIEFFRMAELSGIKPATKTTLLFCQIILITKYLEVINLIPEFIADSILPIACISICGWLLIQPISGKISDIASSIFGLFYLGFLPSHWIMLRSLNNINQTFWDISSNNSKIFLNNTSMLITFSICLMIVASDIGSFVFGKRFGRSKLTQLSPSKTIEGTLGGVLSSISVGVIISQVLNWSNGFLIGILLGIFVSFFSLIGDLIESMMKRDAGLKDSGDFLPGHGGILDRIDSYIFTPAAVYYLILFLENSPQ